MSGFDSIVDQERIVRRLSKISRNVFIPHALLFTGPEGVGKKRAAKVFAMACNCLRGKGSVHEPFDDSHPPSVETESDALPCGACRSCRKIAAEVHPDINFLQPQKATIRISQIRDLCHILAMKPYEARQRVVIISDAHSLSPEAGNSLLKMLEEPPDKTLLILTAPSSQNLLPTIVSRCQHFRFNPIAHGTLMRLLMDDHGVQPKEADVLSRLANGSITKARSLVETEWLQRRKWILDMLIANEAAQDPAGPNLLLAFSSRIAGRKADLSDSLDTMKSWFRDLMIFPWDPDKVINKDRVDKIQALSQQMDSRLWVSHFDAVEKAQEMIAGNANPRLTMDVLMMHITGYSPS